MAAVLVSVALSVTLAGLLAAQQPKSQAASRNDAARERADMQRIMAENLKGTHDLMTALALENCKSSNCWKREAADVSSPEGAQAT